MAIVETHAVEPFWEGEGLTIYHGDCAEVLPALFPNPAHLLAAAELPDLMLTDPPYGVKVTRMALGGRHAKKLYRGEDHWDDDVPDINALLQYATDQVVWGGNCFDLPTQPSGWLVWDKLNDGMSFGDCELAWSTSGMPVRRKVLAWGGAHAKERADPDRYHPTQKPVALMRWCLDFFPKAQLVIDPFMGSGTTLRACKNKGIRAIGIERDVKFCEVAVERLRQEVLL